jgi:hypothetical protein
LFVSKKEKKRKEKKREEKRREEKRREEEVTLVSDHNGSPKRPPAAISFVSKPNSCDVEHNNGHRKPQNC